MYTPVQGLAPPGSVSDIGSSQRTAARTYHTIRSHNLSDEPPKKQGGSLILTAVLGLIGALIPTLVIMLLVRTCDGPKKERVYEYQREKREKPVLKREEESVMTNRAVEDTSLTQGDRFLSLEEGLLALAPGIYLSVRFLHENGDALSLDELDAAEGVHTIEITVKAEPWDALKPEDRVKLLNRTFEYITEHYPDMTKFLRLVYDDNRPAFDMRFGSEL